MFYKSFKSKKEHKFKIILLHGMNMNISYLFKTVKYLQKNNKNLKIILPIADKININWPQGIEYNISSWYDYFTRNDNLLKHDEIDIQQFERQTNNIYKIIDNEIKILCESKKIIIAGISQGGTLALNIGINYKCRLAGIIGIHTLFLGDLINIPTINNVYKYTNFPIFLFSGDKDKIYNIKFQDLNLNPLRMKKFKIFWKIEKNLGHCKKSKNELKFISESINYLFKQN